MQTSTTKPGAEAAAAEQSLRRRRQAEGSFSLIETVIALSLVTFLIFEVSAVQGNSLVFSDYGRNVTQATWLAKRVMSQVEYFWRTKEFTELRKENVEEIKFDDFPEYSYRLEIKEWKFPFAQLLEQALGGGATGSDEAGEGGSDDDESDTGDDPSGGMIETVVKQVFGDEPVMMTAHVEVLWAEGAQSNSTSMTLLLTNQAKIDEAIAAQKAVYERLTKPQQPAPPAG